MKICKLCEKEMEKGRFKYCLECRTKWKKPRDRYYYLQSRQTEEYKEGAIKRSQQWQKDNPERHKQYMDKYRHDLKIEALTFYSPIDMPCCSLCGNSNINVLALDHVNNDGNKDTKAGISLYNHALLIKDKSQFQTLCFNCNWKKHIINLKNRKDKGPKHEYSYKRNLSFKTECVSHYSDNTCKCSKCGENDMDVLCLDHINDNGAEHRAIVGSGGKVMYRWAIKNNFPPMFQVLCMNCNIDKQRNK
jgi:hypothetical protein